MTIKTFFHAIINFSRKTKEDHVAAYAGQATLFILISFFPFLMFLLTLIRYLPITESNVMFIVDYMFPSNISPIFIRIVVEAYEKGSATIMSITAITALWSASRGFIALTRGLNCVYGIKETRGYFKTRITSALYTLIFALILVITLVVLVFGNRLYIWLGSVFPIIKETALIIISLRAVVGLTILVIFFTILFLAIPNRKSKLKDELPGALVAAGGWMGFSYLYSFYIDNMANISNTYGSLAAIIFLVLWLYFCMYILFIGGEVNDVLSSKSLQEALKSPKKYDSRCE